MAPASKGGQTVKKNKLKPAEQGHDGPPGAVPKQAKPRLPQPVEDGLTCNEAQVEDLLAEGEST